LEIEANSFISKQQNDLAYASHNTVQLVLKSKKGDAENHMISLIFV
jgi:hypothetical protein